MLLQKEELLKLLRNEQQQLKLRLRRVSSGDSGTKTSKRRG